MHKAAINFHSSNQLVDAIRSLNNTGIIQTVEINTMREKNSLVVKPGVSAIIIKPGPEEDPFLTQSKIFIEVKGNLRTISKIINKTKTFLILSKSPNNTLLNSCNDSVLIKPYFVFEVNC